MEKAEAPVRFSFKWIFQSELTRYFLASGFALMVDIAAFRCMTMLGVPYLIAALLGFFVGLLINYVLSVGWVFSFRRVSKSSREFTSFALIGVMGLMLLELLLWVSVDFGGLSAFNARIFATLPVFLFNFLARKTVLFSRIS